MNHVGSYLVMTSSVLATKIERNSIGDIIILWCMLYFISIFILSQEWR